MQLVGLCSGANCCEFTGATWSLRSGVCWNGNRMFLETVISDCGMLHTVCSLLVVVCSLYIVCI